MALLKAHLVLEVMGRPAPHIKKALKEIVGKIKAEKGINLLKDNYHPAKKVEGSKDIYTSFAEIDAEFDSLEKLFWVVMAYMPSNIEVYEPDKLKMSSSDINGFANHLVSKLHGYDEIAKKIIAERNILHNQLQQLKAGGSDVQADDKKPKKASSKKKKN